ncbi:hypothetical protein V8F33_006758 [Rhypophila sp. PSN 637]
MASSSQHPNKPRWEPGMDLYGPGVYPTGFDQRGNRVRLQSVRTSGAGTHEDPLICYSWDYNLDKNLKQPERREYLERELKDVCRVTRMTCMVLRTNTHSRTVKTVKGPDGENLKIQVSCPSRYTVYLGHNFRGALLEGHIFTRVKYRPGRGFTGDFTIQIDDEDWNDRWNKDNLAPIELWLTSRAFKKAPAPPKTGDLEEFPDLGAATPAKKKNTAPPKTPGRVTIPSAIAHSIRVYANAIGPSANSAGFRPQSRGPNIPQYDGADERTEEDDDPVGWQRWNQARQNTRLRYIDAFVVPPRSWDNPWTHLIDYPEVFISVDPITRYVYHVVEGPQGQPRWFFYDNDTSYEYDPLSGYHKQVDPDGTITWWVTNYITSDDRADHGPATWGLYQKARGPAMFPMWDSSLQRWHEQAKAEMEAIKDQQAQADREAQQALTEEGEPMDTS